ncbi:MAG: hypothetical protein R2761_15670 [Acidimicrobiales bacterium]
MTVAPQAAGAAEGPTGGGGTDAGGLPGGIYANAVRPGHRGSGGGAESVGCPWQSVWKAASPLESLASILQSWFSGNVDPGTTDPATVEVVPDGTTAPDGTTVTPIGEVVGRNPEDIVVGSYQGRNVNWINQFVLYVLGTQPLGVFIDNPQQAQLLSDAKNAQTPVTNPDGSLALEVEDIYENNALYPKIQRGDDWWDPYYISLEDALTRPQCPSRLIYVPRNDNARAFLPDVQKLFIDLLPDPTAEIQPLDRNRGWAYVQVPTDFTATPASLAPPFAHAEIPAPGGNTIWIEATATPTYYILDPGDGTPAVACAVSEAHFDPAAPSECSHTYLDSSATAPGGVFTATLYILWQGSYESSSGPGTFAVPSTQVSFPVQVAEARPVGVAN